jgi:hypothetical protein
MKEEVNFEQNAIHGCFRVENAHRVLGQCFGAPAALRNWKKKINV